MSRPNLNEKQQAVYHCIINAMAEGLPPTVREICAATGIKSTSTVHAVLKKLEEAGYITRGAGSSRYIRVEGAAPMSQVPLVGRITAGVPILAVEEIEDYIPFPTKDNTGLFADIIIADKEKVARNGDIVVGMIEDEATVKRLGFENGKPVLYPENPDFSPIYADYIEILGVVVGSFRQY